MPEIKKKNILVQKIYLYTEIDGILNNLITNLRVKYFYCEATCSSVTAQKKSENQPSSGTHRKKSNPLCTKNYSLDKNIPIHLITVSMTS